VTGYELPQPRTLRVGKAGARLDAPSQDTGAVKLVTVPHQGPASPSKRRMRPVLRTVFAGAQLSPSLSV
jgi:hypothetical protein